MRKRSRRKVRRATNPVNMAVARWDIGQAMGDIAIRAYLTQDQATDRDLIAQLAFVIGIGADVAANLPGYPSARAMHGALRTLLSMSVDGGRWQASQARLMHEIATEASQLAITHAGLAQTMQGAALHLSHRIATGTATMDDVVGAEIYRDDAHV